MISEADVVPQGATPREKRRVRLLFVGLMVGLLLSELDQTIFATALPTVVGELRGVDQMLWVTTAYALAGTVMMPVYGKLGDRIGRRQLFVAALAIFVLGSVVGGLAPSMGWLIAGRAVQGLGGGGLLILIQAIVADVIPARERAPYMSVIGAVFALAAVLGPFLGGWFAQGVGWRWALWMNVPLGGAAIVLATVLLPTPPVRVPRAKADVWGFTTLAAAVSAVVLLASWGGTRYAWTSPVVLTLASLAVLATLAFVAVERRVDEPIIPMSLFTRRNFAVATFAGLVMAVAMFGTLGYLPTYLQMVNGLSARDSGLVLLSLIFGVMSTTLVSAQIVSRTGHYKSLPIVGTALVTVALALLSTLHEGSQLRTIALFLFLLGAGIGCALEILVIIVQNTVPAAQVGTATATTSFFREIGVSLGSAVVGTLFTSRLAALLAERLPAGPVAQLDAQSLVPAQVAALPAEVRAGVAASYADALTPVFLLLVPVMLVSVVALCFVDPVPLATTVQVPRGRDSRDPAERPEDEPGPAPDHPGPRFSVVVPAYNEAGFLGATLTALQQQRVAGGVEIIVVDNNSSDDTADVAARHGARVVFEAQPGVCSARQRGTLEASGDIVVSTDADTIHPPDWLARMDDALRSSPDAVAVAGPCRYQDPPWWAAVFPPLWFAAVALFYSCFGRIFYVTATNLAFRRTAFPGYDTALTQGGDEVDFLRRLRRRGRVVWDRHNPVLTSSRRMDQGLLYTLVVSFGYYYALSYVLNRWSARTVLGPAPAIRHEQRDLVRRRRLRWRFALSVIVLGLAGLAWTRSAPPGMTTGLTQLLAWL